MRLVGYLLSIILYPARPRRIIVKYNTCKKKKQKQTNKLTQLNAHTLTKLTKQMTYIVTYEETQA